MDMLIKVHVPILMEEGWWWSRTNGVILYMHSDTAETAVKARREIADYMKSGRIERARIRVSWHAL